MYEALLGKEGFRKGMDLYFSRHDGQVNRHIRFEGRAGATACCLVRGGTIGARCPRSVACDCFPTASTCLHTPWHHRHQAVTCDDFLAAMADANGEDLSGLAK